MESATWTSSKPHHHRQPQVGFGGGTSCLEIRGREQARCLDVRVSAHRHNDSTSTQTDRVGRLIPDHNSLHHGLLRPLRPLPPHRPTPQSPSATSRVSPRPLSGACRVMARLTLPGPSQDRPMTSPGPSAPPRTRRALPSSRPRAPASRHWCPNPRHHPYQAQHRAHETKTQPTQPEDNSNDLITRTTLEVPSSPTTAALSCSAAP